MKLTMRVTKVATRTETIQERDKPDRAQRFEDVLLEATGGEAFQGSAAAQLRLTVDHPGALGALPEGATVEVTLAVQPAS